MEMGSEHYKQVVNDYIRLMSAGDWQGVAKLYADDATVEDPVGSEPVRGIEAVTAFYKRNTTNPMKLELAGPIRVAGIETAFPFTVSVNYQGTPMHIHVIDVFKFNAEGKVVSMRAYFGEENFVPA
jgi:steroid delta-isomerase